MAAIHVGSHGLIGTLLRYVKSSSNIGASLFFSRHVGEYRHVILMDKPVKPDRGIAAPELTMLFDESEISARVEELARAAAARLPENFVVVGLLVGSFVFVADLQRALYRLGCNPTVEFMRLSSYGIERKSSGNVRLTGDFDLDLSGRAVLLVDDIVDTGRTLLYARDLLKERHAAKILTCALVDKPSRREVPFEVDLVGFTIPDVFIVGYGIDYAHEYRHLPFIARID